MKSNNHLFVIVPSYNEDRNIENTFTRISSILENAKIKHTIVFVDDGSKDNTWNEISKLSSKTNVMGIRFSRNFGKESAIYAGLEKAYNEKCDCAVVIDCDLQHPPEKIVEMYQLWENKYEVVECVKNSRGTEGLLHKFSASIFYRIISKAVGIDMRKASDFKLLDRKVIESVLKVKEKDAFFRAVSSWVGYSVVQIQFDVSERQNGQTKWSTKSLIKYAINNITAFSFFPLLLITAFGFLSEIAMVVLLILSVVFNTLGAITFCILLQLLLSGIIMIALGIEGYYISKVCTEVKNRPKFIVSEEIDSDNA